MTAQACLADGSVVSELELRTATNRPPPRVPVPASCQRETTGASGQEGVRAPEPAEGSNTARVGPAGRPSMDPAGCPPCAAARGASPAPASPLQDPRPSP